MKKGLWQQGYDDHIQLYGESFINTKDFNLHIDSDIMNDYIKPMWESNNGECDIFEFGVYTGGTLRDIVFQLNNNNLNPKNVWGFDSFEGLPQEIEDIEIEGKHWNQGAFSACDALCKWDWKELESEILKTINADNVKLIKGFYEDTLNSKLVKENKFNSAMFVHIDVDLYKSTIEVLEWLFSNKIVRVGTIIRYDDIGVVPETAGELRAHIEMCEKYNIKCDRLSNKQYFLISEM